MRQVGEKERCDMFRGLGERGFGTGRILGNNVPKQDRFVGVQLIDNYFFFGILLEHWLERR